MTRNQFLYHDISFSEGAKFGFYLLTAIPAETERDKAVKINSPIIELFFYFLTVYAKLSSVLNFSLS